MAERRPNSVLMSLKELRRIEDDRVKQEERSEMERREREQRAREEAARRAQDEEDRRRQEEAARIRREQEEEQNRIREEQLRLQEAERRARVEAEMKLEQSRIALEIDAAARAKKLPWGTIGTIIGILVFGVAALGYFSYQKSKNEKQIQSQLEAQRKEAAEFRKKVEAKENLFKQEQEEAARNIAKLEGQLGHAKSDAQKKAIRELIAAKFKEKENLAKARARQREQERERAKRIEKRCKNPDDPLCGIE